MIYLQPRNAARNLWRNRDLIIELTRRELSQRYRGSFLGVLWSLLVPFVMLVIYTFVFSFIFKARWNVNGEQASSVDYALTLFAGMTAFNVFSELVTRSATLITGMPNYVKKVVFPLEVYPLVILLVAVVMSFINIGLLLVANLLLAHSISRTLFLLPLAYLPLIFLCLGLGWFFSAIGVYIRDLAQIVPVFTTMMFFLSPIVYPLSIVPEPLQPILQLNPLTTITECFRQSLIWGGPLPWFEWSVWTVLSLCLALLGYAWFMGTKKGFADVL